MSGWPDHRGELLPDAEFWCPPDPRIGAVVSAWSNQVAGGAVRATPRAEVGRLLLLTAWLLAVFVGIMLVLSDEIGRMNAGIFSGIAVAVAVAMAGLFLRPRHHRRCTYVGEEGFSDHSIGRIGSGDHRVVRFADVDGMWVSSVDHHTNGLYQHTDTRVTWREEGGRTLHETALRSFERGIPAMIGPGTTPDEVFLAAIQARWGKHRLARVERHLAEVGAAIFRLDDGGYATVRPASVELYRARQRTVLTARTVEEVSVVEGSVVFRGRETLAVPAREIADLMVFLATAQAVAGIRVVRTPER